jgi:hypothetical protein
MSKPTKTSLALGRFKSKEQRDQWKRAMIDAELCSKIVVKPLKKENRPGGSYTTTSNSATASE